MLSREEFLGAALSWDFMVRWLGNLGSCHQRIRRKFVSQIFGNFGPVDSWAQKPGKLWYRPWVSTSQWIPWPVSWHSSMTEPILAGHWVLQTQWPSFESGNCRDQFSYWVVQTQWLVVPAEWGIGSTDNHINNWSPSLTLLGQ
jgi:hypothetical protein